MSSSREINIDPISDASKELILQKLRQHLGAQYLDEGVCIVCDRITPRSSVTVKTWSSVFIDEKSSGIKNENLNNNDDSENSSDENSKSNNFEMTNEIFSDNDDSENTQKYQINYGIMKNITYTTHVLLTNTL